MNIVIKTQAEWDALPKSFGSWTTIEIRSSADFYLQVNTVPANARVEARESSHVEAWGSSHVVARESSHVVAWESSHVVARESSHVEAWGSSRVEARESSHVVAWESSHVEARESSHVVAWESSHVVAWESSRVEAWESSHVEARGSVAVHLKSDGASVLLFMFAVCFALAKGKIEKKSKTCTVITPKSKPGTAGWLDSQAIKPAKSIILFKRVSTDFKTQERTSRETLWAVGASLAHPAWDPEPTECGPGKFHACSRAYFCDEFRNEKGDRYIAIEIKKSDLFAFPKPEYPHKIAFRAGKVLYECDRYGKQIGGAA